MFSGIIEHVCPIRRIASVPAGGVRLDVATRVPASLGDSIAINGCCLTVESIIDDTLTFSLSAETLLRTSFSALSVGNLVNVERALKLGDHLAGHLVSGHVDGTRTVNFLQHKEGFALLQVQLTAEDLSLVVPKGSLCVHGVSLTINSLNHDGSVDFTLVPYTLEHTNLRLLSAGDRVNIEFDMIGKFIERQTKAYVSPK